MTNRSEIEQTVRAFYAARVNDDVDATVKHLAEDVVFELNGRGTGVPALSEVARGKAAVKAVASGLIATWRFSDFRECSLVIDGERAALHWKARVTFRPNGKSEIFDFFDHIQFRDGKIVQVRQNTDTAQAIAMTAA